jgi:hypothetical protein
MAEADTADKYTSVCRMTVLRTARAHEVHKCFWLRTEVKNRKRACDITDDKCLLEKMKRKRKLPNTLKDIFNDICLTQRLAFYAL